MMQVVLDLRQPRRPGREQPPIKRLQALLRRRNINPTWRTDGNHKMWLLPLVGIDVGERHRTEPRGAHSSLPVQGVWETLCAWHVNAAPHCPEVVPHYRERDDIADHLSEAQQQASTVPSDCPDSHQPAQDRRIFS